MTVTEDRPGTALVPASRLPVVAPREVVPAPVVVVGEVVFSWPRPVPWAVTDPTQILAIALRIEHYRKPWWKRMGTPPPTPGTASRAQLGQACRGRVLLLSVRTAG